MSKTPNFRNPSTNPFSLELISSLQISRESLSVRGLPLARLILVGQMRKGRVVVKAGGWNGKWGRSVFDIPLYRSPNLPPTTLSLTSLRLDRGSTTHIPPPPPPTFIFHFGSTEVEHDTCTSPCSTHVSSFLSSHLPLSVRRRKIGHFIHRTWSRIVRVRCEKQSRESEGILNPRVRMSKDAVFFFLFIPPSRKIRYFLYMDIVYIYLIIFIFCTRHIIVILLLRIYLPVYVYIRKSCCSVDNLFKCKYELLIQAISMYNKWHDYSSKRWKNKINNSFFFFPHRSH